MRKYHDRLEWDKVKHLSDKQDPVISAHTDADGLSSASLLAKALEKDYDDVTFVFPKTFGDADSLTKPDIFVDQAPNDPTYDGIVVDHHPAHFQEGRENNYHLVWSNRFCASRLIYESLKDKIPEQEHWKVAIGMAGDGRDDQIPPEIFIKSPELLDETGYTYGKQYGSKMDYSAQFEYIMAKSLINYGTRVGDFEFTLRKLMNADTVYDITNDNWLLNCKDKVKSTLKNMYRDQDQFKITVWRNIGYCEYETDLKLWTATDFFNRINKTAVALNKTMNKFSIRGPLALIVAKMLNRIDGINAGGHYHYAGGTLESRSPEFLRKQLAIIDQHWKEENIEDYYEDHMRS